MTRPSRQIVGVLAVLLLAACSLARAEKIADIRPQGYVTDLAGVVGADTRARIEALAKEVEQKTGAQIAVVTVKSLDGIPKEDYAADLYKSLGVGSKKSNRGVLLLVAPNDRQYRVEVGYGLEPVINDARAGDIGRAMVPYLKSGNYDSAILTGTTQIAQLIAADSGVQLTGLPARRPQQQPASDRPWWLPLLLPIGIFLLVRWLSRRGRGGPSGGVSSGTSALPWIMMGSGMGRGGWGGGFGGSSGGWGGGGGGGGGFGGFGGGMSGGGGAGGSW